MHLLRQLDVPPRQVLIDAKIYEVELSGALAEGVTMFLQRRGVDGTGQAPASAPSRILSVATGGAGLNLTAGALVLKSHELLARYAARVYRLTGSYEEAARRMGIDRRTVKAKVELYLEAENRT